MWSMWGSNSQPSRYQHDALPTELMDQLAITEFINTHIVKTLHITLYYTYLASQDCTEGNNDQDIEHCTPMNVCMWEKK